MKIVHINAPYVITDDGKQILISNIVGHPKVGVDLLVSNDEKYVISAVTSDSECVNGVCPIK